VVQRLHSPLNIPIGQPTSITNEWKTRTKNLQTKSRQLQNTYHTFKTKSIISKTQLMPSITQLANTYPMPNTCRDTINETISSFISESNQLTLLIDTLARTLQHQLPIYLVMLNCFTYNPL